MLVLLLGACVSRSKYVNDTGTMQTKLDESTAELDQRTKDLAQRTKDLAQRTKDLDRTTTDLAQRTAELAQRAKALAELRSTSDMEIAEKRALLAKLEADLKRAAAEQRLLAEDARKRQSELNASLTASQAEIKELQAQRARNEKRLEQFRALRRQLKEMISAGNIKVYQRRGRIMVALPSSVLFASGNADLSSAGKKALARVAKVLAKLMSRRFLIAGHTDNNPIKTRRFPDNWSLSSARATNVTRFLVQKGMAGDSLAAAGYGEFDPITANDSDTSRKTNRRIEIILVPNLENLDLND